eukprot:TRINITY_DN8993_c0_g2_i3.p1 TRINITY_DN8993_c0_g2~~TRINITY_DN8993_c0_g2_i3.p1  ORF type:complete len:121 (-),score=29.40 TRINITY_DN8993_c0_g2_i3:134-496(-)
MKQKSFMALQVNRQPLSNELPEVQKDSLREMIDEKYSRYVEKKKEQTAKICAGKSSLKPKPRKSSVVSKKSAPNTQARKSMKPMYKVKKNITLGAALKIITDHAKECPQFHRKLKLAGIL